MKMLMEIDPLPMRGSLVMTMASISPSRREVSLAEQLRRSPRLVPPRFRLETAALRPESFLMIFSRSKDTLYQKMGIGVLLGGPRGRGHALHPRGHLACFLTSTPSPLDHVCSKNHAPEGFIPFGLCLIFLFFETLK